MTNIMEVLIVNIGNYRDQKEIKHEDVVDKK